MFQRLYFYLESSYPFLYPRAHLLKTLAKAKQKLKWADAYERSNKPNVNMHV